MQASELFDWPDSLNPFAAFFPLEAHPWEWLPQIRKALESYDFPEVCATRKRSPAVQIGKQVYLHPSVKLPAFCQIEGPAWIGPDVEIRPGAYIRSWVIVGAGSVLGNSCEYKNCLLMENVETPHYNYVGDSILGNRAHLGAGAICANLRLARDHVIIRIEGESFATGMRKVGAMMGDGAEASCNSVLQPGAVLGKRAAVISGAFSGYLPHGKLALGVTRARIISRP